MIRITEKHHADELCRAYFSEVADGQTTKPIATYLASVLGCSNAEAQRVVALAQDGRPWDTFVAEVQGLVVPTEPEASDANRSNPTVVTQAPGPDSLQTMRYRGARFLLGETITGGLSGAQAVVVDILTCVGKHGGCKNPVYQGGLCWACWCEDRRTSSPVTRFDVKETIIIAGRGTLHIVRKPSGVPMPKTGDTVELYSRLARVTAVEKNAVNLSDESWTDWTGLIGIMAEPIPSPALAFLHDEVVVDVDAIRKRHEREDAANQEFSDLLEGTVRGCAVPPFTAEPSPLPDTWGHIPVASATFGRLDPMDSFATISATVRWPDGRTEVLQGVETIKQARRDGAVLVPPPGVMPDYTESSPQTPDRSLRHLAKTPSFFSRNLSAAPIPTSGSTDMSTPDTLAEREATVRYLRAERDRLNRNPDLTAVLALNTFEDAADEIAAGVHRTDFQVPDELTRLRADAKKYPVRDAQNWHTVRDLVLELDAVERPHPPGSPKMDDDDVLSILGEVLLRAVKDSKKRRAESLSRSIPEKVSAAIEDLHEHLRLHPELKPTGFQGIGCRWHNNAWSVVVYLDEAAAPPAAGFPARDALNGFEIVIVHRPRPTDEPKPTGFPISDLDPSLREAATVLHERWVRQWPGIKDYTTGRFQTAEPNPPGNGPRADVPELGTVSGRVSASTLNQGNGPRAAGYANVDEVPPNTTDYIARKPWLEGGPPYSEGDVILDRSTSRTVTISTHLTLVPDAHGLGRELNRMWGYPDGLIPLSAQWMDPAHRAAAHEVMSVLKLPVTVELCLGLDGTTTVERVALETDGPVHDCTLTHPTHPHVPGRKLLFVDVPAYAADRLRDGAQVTLRVKPR